MKYMPAFLLGTLMAVTSIAQPVNNIIGKVINEKSGEGIPNASIFISNTSKGTISNSKGEFELMNVPEGTYDLVVSCIGYETFVYTYKLIQLPLRIEVRMANKLEELQTVVIEPFEKDGWKSWGPFFMENFIGTSANAKKCTIKNYTALHFRKSKKKNQLTVTADEPLIVENKALGYKIQYQLEGFSFDFGKNILQYAGYTLFDELNKKGPGKHQIKNREKAYRGSITHFMASLYKNRLLEEGFEVKRLYKKPNLEKERIKKIYASSASLRTINSTSRDSSGYYEHILRQPNEIETYGKTFLTADSLIVAPDAANIRLFFDNYLDVFYKKEKEDKEYLQSINEKRLPWYRHSVVFLNNGRAILIDANGNYAMPLDFMSYGYWSWSEKIATLLPLDYKSGANK
jgi:CarboxypepD_reg-like domain